MISEEFELLLIEAEEHMEESLKHLFGELNAIRAGRATPAMVDRVRVDYYGSQTPLSQMASVSAPAPDLLVIQPWDKTVLGDIERAILKANLGFNPSNDGELIRIPVPPLSEERRRELAKTVKQRSDEGKISVRNVRRHMRDVIKKTQKSENLPEDMLYEAEEQLQKMTDSYIHKMDTAYERKQAEIMEV